MDKSQLRQILQKTLMLIPVEERAKKSRKACRNLIFTPEFQKASTVMLYLSLPDEVDTSEVFLHAWQKGKTVAVPKVSWQQRRMIPVEINSLETDMSVGASGLRTPTTGRPIPLGEIELVVTPALGYDGSGNRLGRGGSYYDRFFSNEELRACKCGFCFAEQQVDSIPVSDYDVAVDILVTDEEVLYFGAGVGSRQ